MNNFEKWEERKRERMEKWRNQRLPLFLLRLRNEREGKGSEKMKKWKRERERIREGVDEILHTNVVTTIADSFRSLEQGFTVFKLGTLSSKATVTSKRCIVSKQFICQNLGFFYLKAYLLQFFHAKFQHFFFNWFSLYIIFRYTQIFLKSSNSYTK